MPSFEHVRGFGNRYDLYADPHELHNLALKDEQQVRKEALKKVLERWMQQQGDLDPVGLEEKIPQRTPNTKDVCLSYTNADGSMPAPAAEGAAGICKTGSVRDLYAYPGSLAPAATTTTATTTASTQTSRKPGLAPKLCPGGVIRNYDNPIANRRGRYMRGKGQINFREGLPLSVCALECLNWELCHAFSFRGGDRPSLCFMYTQVGSHPSYSVYSGSQLYRKRAYGCT